VAIGAEYYSDHGGAYTMHGYVMDLDDYELISGSEGEYGRESLRRIGAEDELLETIDG